MDKIEDELVPMLEGTIQNQPCVYGELVEGHSVYCNNKRSSYRKCRCSWYYGRAVSLLDNCADEDCRYFKANPAYQEDIDKLAMSIAEEIYLREEAEREAHQYTAEGYLCHRCMNGLPLKNKKVICNMNERKWQSEGNSSILILPDGTEIDWKKECEFFQDWGAFEEDLLSEKDTPA